MTATLLCGRERRPNGVMGGGPDASVALWCFGVWQPPHRVG